MIFRIDLKIFLFLIIFYFTTQIEIYLIIMFFTLLHELGHLLAGIIAGMKPEKLEIRPYGISIAFKLFPKDYNVKIGRGNKLELKKIFVALAGPLVNLIIIVIALNIKLNEDIKNIIIYSNLLLILFNLIPIYPLDGGRIIKSILHICLGKRKSEKIINNTSFIILMIITAISSILVYKLENISIFIIIIVLWIIFIVEDIRYKKKNEIYKLAEKLLK